MYMDRGMVQRGIETVRRQRALRTSCDRAALSRWRVRLRALLARMQACEHRRGSVYRQHLLQQRDFWWRSTSARACARRLELDSQRSFVRAVRIACRFVAALLLAVGAVQRMSCTQISSRISSGTTFCAVLVLHKWTRVCCLRVATCRGLGKAGWGREGGDGSLDRVLIACFLCRYAGRGKEQAPF